VGSALTEDEMRNAARRQGIPDDLIERTLAARRGDQSTAVVPVYEARHEPLDLPQIQWPVTLTLPWSSLISDNRKYGVIAGKMLLTSDYRRAKGQIRELARSKLGGVEPVSVPLTLTARVWVPDEMRAHDTANFGKCTHDALEGIVYTRDRWLWRTTWEHAGCDVDAPRAEITIRPMLG
jgi:hypothetical protein